jgi:hypothetical protein
MPLTPAIRPFRKRKRAADAPINKPPSSADTRVKLFIVAIVFANAAYYEQRLLSAFFDFTTVSFTVFTEKSTQDLALANTLGR